MSFLDELQKNTNRTYTENGAVTNQSTLNPLLDFFSLAGAMRDNIDDAVSLFEKAFYADKQGAIRTLFYLRDVRGGQGEREIFRACFNKLHSLDSELANRLLMHIPEYGRWDDIFAINTEASVLIRPHLKLDERNMAEGKPVSLMAKWLPSENTSSRKTSEKARALAKSLGLKPSQYRKKVVALRKYISLLEHKMSNNEWSEIDYSKLPSQAGRKHVKAFRKHDNDRYEKYLGAAEKGEAKINVSTLYTYEVFDTVSKDVKAANAMWANLPDYTNGTDALVVADVSGSMYGRPMSVSVSLALYFAERNKGIFSNKFMTFSERPQVVDVVGRTLEQKLRMIESSNWGYNTNLEAVFRAILQAAVASGQGQDGMPRVLYIISDMEFDQAVSHPDKSVFTNAELAFKEVGLELPHVVFWNVDARQIQAPATMFDSRVTLISGLSQTTFRYAVEGKTPEQLMDEVINGERYKPIEI